MKDQVTLGNSMTFPTYNFTPEESAIIEGESPGFAARAATPPCWLASSFAPDEIPVFGPPQSSGGGGPVASSRYLRSSEGKMPCKHRKIEDDSMARADLYPFDHNKPCGSGRASSPTRSVGGFLQVGNKWHLDKVTRKSPV
jgi:hypothetical protein